MGTYFKTPDTLVRTLAHTLDKGEASKTLLEATSEILMMAKSNPLYGADVWNGLETSLIEVDAVD